ncbi:MAG TPA: hypothetical protein VHV10_15545 [Ktedonobacteraceae bacterium]|jgi:hypothetical protein|nr:hypothetical protein [Ktedonobacteraceae bacterium]
MNAIQMQSRKERREDAKALTVSTHHNGRFGVWKWTDLTEQERAWYMEAQRRNQYVQTFGVYA